MTHGTKRSSSIEKILDVVFATEHIYDLKDSKFDHLEFF